jgi:hypothetical protein
MLTRVRIAAKQRLIRLCFAFQAYASTMKQGDPQCRNEAENGEVAQSNAIDIKRHRFPHCIVRYRGLFAVSPLPDLHVMFCML